MNAVRRRFAPALILLLAAAGAAPAQYGRVYRPVPEHMPGWDWRYIYPYSPYNYGRNPYNPIIVPYTTAVPVPVPVPVPAYGPYNADAPDGASFPTASGQQVLMPHPTGPTQTPPPGAAVVQVRVPDAEAHVLLDGERTFTEGTNRYFITPELPEGKPYHYAVSATWKRDGNDVTMERQIEVKTGQTTVVDFARPAK